MNSIERHAAVESLAYYLWTTRGKPTGSPEIDWLEAERRLEASDGETDDRIVSSSTVASRRGVDGEARTR